MRSCTTAKRPPKHDGIDPVSRSRVTACTLPEARSRGARHRRGKAAEYLPNHLLVSVRRVGCRVAARAGGGGAAHARASSAGGGGGVVAVADEDDRRAGRFSPGP